MTLTFRRLPGGSRARLAPTRRNGDALAVGESPTRRRPLADTPAGTATPLVGHAKPRGWRQNGSRGPRILRAPDHREIG
jgi:hypothetical protein